MKYTVFKLALPVNGDLHLRKNERIKLKINQKI